MLRPKCFEFFVDLVARCGAGCGDDDDLPVFVDLDPRYVKARRANSGDRTLHVDLPKRRGTTGQG
jgi:hypothetical protein